MRCKNEVRRDGSQFYASVHRFRNRQSQAWLKLAEVFTPVIETELDEMEVYNTVLRIEFSALRSAFKSQTTSGSASRPRARRRTSGGSRFACQRKEDGFSCWYAGTGGGRGRKSLLNAGERPRISEPTQRQVSALRLQLSAERAEPSDHALRSSLHVDELFGEQVDD